MKRFAGLAVRAAAAVWCAPALAALPLVPSPAPAPAAGSGLLQAAFGLVLVLALILGLAWLARRFGLQRLGGSAVVKVVASTAIGTRERVVVVEVGGTWLVLGVAAGRVNALHSLPAQARAESSAGGASAESAGTALERFSTTLREALGQRTPTP